MCFSEAHLLRFLSCVLLLLAVSGYIWKDRGRRKFPYYLGIGAASTDASQETKSSVGGGGCHWD